MEGFSIKKAVVCGLLVFVAGGGIGIAVGGNMAGKTAETASMSVETTAAELTSVAQTAAEATTIGETAIDGVEFVVEKGDNWKNGEKFCVKYEVKIKNNGDAVTDWQAVLDYNTAFKITQLWNGNYTVSGNSLKVTAVDYNKEIPSGGEIGFGFIGEFDADPGCTSAKLFSGGKEVKGSSGSSVLGKAGETGSNIIDTVNAVPKTSKDMPQGTPVQLNGKLSVKGTQIVNQNGQPFVVKGISTHGIAWFPQYVNLESFRTLRDKMGANTVRLALYSSTNEGYNKELHKKVDEGVKYATDLGMYVVIDWHVLGNGNPNTDKAGAEAFFKEMTAKYKNYDNVIYEICNEPNGDVQWERDIKPYAQSIISLIRQNDNDAIVICGTPTWSQDVDVAAKSPLSDKNTVYALHFYAGTHRDDLRNKAKVAIDAGLPIFVSEFGISEASGNGNCDTAEGDRWMEFLDRYGIGRICWSLSNKNETCALVAPECQKTSDWSDNELSAQGKWLKNTYNK